MTEKTKRTQHFSKIFCQPPPLRVVPLATCFSKKKYKVYIKLSLQQLKWSHKKSITITLMANIVLFCKVIKKQTILTSYFPPSQVSCDFEIFRTGKLGAPRRILEPPLLPINIQSNAAIRDLFGGHGIPPPALADLQ
jgi:hypothetical protein